MQSKKLKRNQTRESFRLYFSETDPLDVMTRAAMRAVEEADGGTHSNAAKKLMLVGWLALNGIDANQLLNPTQVPAVPALGAVLEAAKQTAPAAVASTPEAAPVEDPVGEAPAPPPVAAKPRPPRPSPARDLEATSTETPAEDREPTGAGEKASWADDLAHARPAPGPLNRLLGMGRHYPDPQE